MLLTQFYIDTLNIINTVLYRYIKYAICTFIGLFTSIFVHKGEDTLAVFSWTCARQYCCSLLFRQSV